MKILVIGESCVDRFIYCDANRLAPDMPVPVLVKRYLRDNPGMAANVQRNIQVLGASCELTTQPNWLSVIKTRFVHEASNHTFIRVDEGESGIQPFGFIQGILSIIQDFDAVAISDYDKGFLSYDDISMISSAHPLTFLDTKKPITTAFDRCVCIKINTPEYLKSRRVLEENPRLFRKTIITAGSDGCYLNNRHFPTSRVAVGDVSGAGDTFFAGLVVEFLKKKEMFEAITFANQCATQVVGERGVSIPRKNNNE